MIGINYLEECSREPPLSCAIGVYRFFVKVATNAKHLPYSLCFDLFLLILFIWSNDSSEIESKFIKVAGVFSRETRSKIIEKKILRYIGFPLSLNWNKLFKILTQHNLIFS